MSHFIIAEEFDCDYRFVVCDDAPGECSHSEPFVEHRAYIYGKDDNEMPMERIIDEIVLTEKAFVDGARPGIPLPIQGHVLPHMPEGRR